MIMIIIYQKIKFKIKILLAKKAMIKIKNKVIMGLKHMIKINKLN